MISWATQAPTVPPSPFPDLVSALENNNIAFHFSSTDFSKSFSFLGDFTRYRQRSLAFYRGETRGSEGLRELPEVTELIRDVPGISAPLLGSELIVTLHFIWRTGPLGRGRP